MVWRFFALFLGGALILSIFQTFGHSSTNSKARKEYERFESLSLPNTQVRKIYSEHTKQAYRIYVSLPAGYFEDQKKYPSVFILDADYAFALTKQVSEHLSDRGRLPETLLFGIAYDGPLRYRENRTRDYTPSHVLDGGYGEEFQKHSGKAKDFANFLELELIPYLSEKFRLHEKKSIIGHSYGGLFASFMMLEKPAVFNGYIVVSPSLWYDQKLMLKKLEAIKEPKMLKARAFFGIGESENGGHYKMVDDMKKFADLLPKKHKNMAVQSVIFAKENHDTVFPAALTRGLGFVLEGE